MSNINEINDLAANRVNPATFARSRSERVAESRPEVGSQRADQVELSSAARAADASGSTEVRADLVQRIRAEIATGQYETSDKLDRAIEGLVDDLRSA